MKRPSGNKSPRDIWESILSEMDEKMQFGLLEQARNVIDIQIDGEELVLLVESDAAAAFFEIPGNQTRLLIMARPIVQLEKIVIKRA